MWIQDWSWIDLAAVMPWARRDDDALEAFARDLRAQVDQWAIVLHLVMDPLVGLRRAVADRGMAWFDRHAGERKSGMSREERLQALAAKYREQELQQARLLAASGWRQVDLDGEQARTDVARCALKALDDVWASTG